MTLAEVLCDGCHEKDCERSYREGYEDGQFAPEK